ncbi:MAG: UDP-N-acetylmuramoyl-tripeptide--D-alanyl-D-alanine ligase [Bacteroidaceae bacterium]|nr:UDP-N-acetylmuramoyl-tripeptide--D-alanyl-D-alanine ligase [Bacteroidaceae bacterium]
MIDIEQLYARFKQSNGVTTDTRQCKEGMMFFALRGENFDGNRYAVEALGKGCSYVVVDNREYFAEDNPQMIFVDDSLKALQQLARHHRRQLGTTIVGVTGTNGKTTTKELMAAVLKRRYNILYTQGNLNNHIGVPLTLLQLNSLHEMAIVEMGANHPGDIKELVDIAEPDYGVITNVGMAHLQGFGSLEGVIRTKGELYDYIRTTEKRTIFLNDNNEYLKSIASGLTAVRYGRPSEANVLYVAGEVIACDPYLRFRWKEGADEWHEVSTHIVGSYNIDNALCAATVGRYFGVSAEDVSIALAEYIPTNNRSQLTETEHNTLIVDAYNANPTSMRAALDNFVCMEVSPKMVILGDMKELGEATAEAHQTVVDRLAKCDFEQVWLVGAAFAATLHGSARVFTDAEAVKEELQQHPVKKKYILVKGSNSMKLASLIPYL